MAGAADGGTSCSDALEAPNEKMGEAEELFDDCGTGGGAATTTEDPDEPNNPGRFGSVDGSVVEQDRIANRNNNANP